MRCRKRNNDKEPVRFLETSIGGLPCSPAAFPESGAVRRCPAIDAESPESLVPQGTTRSGYIEIQNIACDLIEYA
ncbi:hypothetical protein DF150_15035 [Burkholderia cenocepacia]|nr:hypothetical protein C6T64_10245 [Burkholderia cenocepacia]RQT93779.1 hypothetical protein DF165_16870 [Burkholderia cenocepacia]RQU34399.1 hypothetical protein DF150_15035 [Burkholderia cenocepacia]